MKLTILLHARSARAGALACAVTLTVGAPALGAGTRAAAQARPTAAVAARCATSGLVVWLDTEGNGAAGSIYYSLKLTNLSGRTCTLLGYPGVSAVNLGGRQLGAAASRTASPARLVSLANGATASAVLRIVEAGNFPSSTCRLTTAAGLRVYPPGQRASKVVPVPFAACAGTGPVFLSVKAVA